MNCPEDTIIYKKVQIDEVFFENHVHKRLDETFDMRRPQKWF